MADRVRMKATNVFDNPFVYNHNKDREGRTFVQEGDEFSTEPEHAEELFRASMADKIDGEVSERDARQAMIKGAQTSADTTAITTTRKAPAAASSAPAAAPAASGKAAA